MLLSPAGFTNESQEYMDQMLDHRLGTGKTGFNIFSFLQKLFTKKAYRNKWLPTDILKKIPFNKTIVRNQFIDIFKKENFHMSEELREAWIDYQMTYFYKRVSGDRAMPTFLKYGCYSDEPFGEFMPELMDEYKFVVFYGTEDWMDKESAALKI